MLGEHSGHCGVPGRGTAWPRGSAGAAWQGGRAPHSGMGTGSPVRALGDGEMLSPVSGCSRMCPGAFCHSGAWLSWSSTHSQQNFGLNCVPSLLPSRGHHSPGRAMCQQQGMPLIPRPARGTAPPPRPSRSPTISPTDLPASSPPRCSTPFSRAAALRRTPLHWGTQSHTERSPRPAVRESRAQPRVPSASRLPRRSLCLLLCILTAQPGQAH